MSVEMFEPCLSQGYHRWRARSPDDPGPLVGEPCECGAIIFTQDMDDRRRSAPRLDAPIDWTAYMPVPRCDQCRFWVPPGPRDQYGVCLLSGAGSQVYGEEGGGAIVTLPAFGCVQFKAKPER